MKKFTFLCSLLFVAALFTGCTKEVTDYDLTVTFQDNEITGKYTGILVDNVASDESAYFTYKNDDDYLNYTGGFTEGQFSGNGTIETNFFTPPNHNPGEYNGDIVDGHIKGYGIYTSTNYNNDKFTYSGEWENDMMQGYGKLEWENDSYIHPVGNFEKGEFAPTKSQYLSLFENTNPIDGIVFSITDNAVKYLDNNDVLFPANSFDDIADKVDNNIEFKHLIKNISAYGNELVKLEGGRVRAINEIDDIYQYDLSIVQVEGSHNSFYYIYYFGKLDDIYKGDTVNIYGLPISRTSFTNVGNTTTEAVVMAGSYITKQ